MRKGSFLLALVAAVLVLFVTACTSEEKSVASTEIESVETVQVEESAPCDQDVFFPTNMDSATKYPIVFFAHNGGADKSAWGDFPKAVAEEGFITVNMTWTNWDTTEVENSISYSLKKYAENIDTNNVAFIGGCHGSKDCLQIMSKDNLPYTIKTAVVLALSENDAAVANTQAKAHVPLLVYFATNDRLGPEYQKITKQIATQIITEPKKVVEVNESAHGNELVTMADGKDAIRADIISWVKSYTK